MSLHHAISRDHNEIMMMLLSKDVNIEAKSNMRRIILHLTTSCNNEEIIIALLNHRIDIESKDNEGCILLLIELREKCRETIIMLNRDVNGCSDMTLLLTQEFGDSELMMSMLNSHFFKIEVRDDS